MNGVTVAVQQPLEFANEAEVVLFGSGIYTRAIAENAALMDRLTLDPLRQLIGAQCSGTLLLARLGLIGNMPACTDLTTKPWVVQAGVRVVDEPFHARGPVATAGGCMASQYLATWVMLTRAGLAGHRAGAALRGAGGRERRVREEAHRRGAAVHRRRLHRAPLEPAVPPKSDADLLRVAA